MVQWKTQDFAYWRQSLEITENDIEILYNSIVEAGRPVPLEQLSLALVRGRCQQEEEARKSYLERGAMYRPESEYSVGQNLVFSSFDFALAKVVGKRPGYNPQHGEFSVIQVQFEEEDSLREFASELKAQHKLNEEAVRALNGTADLISPEDLYAQNRAFVDEKVAQGLEDNEEFIKFGGSWFLKEMLADIHLGYCNIAEAMIEVSGKPLPSKELLKELDLSAGYSPEVKEFSLNRALLADGRFENVGPRGETLWFLKRMEPPDLAQVPPRLKAGAFHYDFSLLNPDLRRFVAEIDDELSDPVLAGEVPKLSQVNIVLTYPHYRAGSLPLTPRTRQIFPDGDTHHTMITFVDGSGSSAQGWVIHRNGYVYGLKDWYQQNKIPVGAYIRLQKTGDPLTVEISFAQRRMKRDWVRVATVGDGQLTFQIQSRPVSCEYDELMGIQDDNQTQMDEFWMKAEEKRTSLQTLLREIFPELAKLNPQGTVHAKTLYSAVNIVRRCPPEAVFGELSSRSYFVHVGHGNWIFDPSKHTR